MKKLLLITFFTLISVSANAQVGIGTIVPGAALDINPAANEVPLRIRPSATPPAGLVRGEFYVDNIDGLLYSYDPTRTKWLSVDRNMIGWGRNAAASNEYLRQYNGALSNENGWRMIRNGTITAITVQANAAGTFTIEIRKNDATAVIASLVVSAQPGAHSTTVNINFNQGDFLQCFLNGTNIQTPQVLIETAWRK